MPSHTGSFNREPISNLVGAWLTFVLALGLAMPQPPNPLHLAIGSVAGAVLVFIGFLAASRCRRIPEHPVRIRVRLVLLSAAAGGVLGLVLVAALVFLAHHEPALHARFANRLSEPAWRPLALAFESSVLEEVVFRLFTMSAIAWLAGRLIRSPGVTLLTSVFLSAILFGLAHLPAWLAAAPPTAPLIAAVIFLNGIGGGVFGWVFWRWGLPYAIICHFVGDLIIQGFGPRLLA